MNGLLGAMFNLQQCQISIYHHAQQQTAGETEKGKGRERRIYVFAVLSSASWTEYQLEVRWHRSGSMKRALAVVLCFSGAAAVGDPIFIFFNLNSWQTGW